MRQRVGDRQHDAAVLARQVVEQADDFSLGARVEAGGDFVAEQDFRIGHQLHGQSEAAFLAAGQDPDRAVADGGEAGFLQHAVDPLVEFRGVAATHPQAGGRFHRFIDRERVIGDGKLRHIADFGGREIAALRKVAAIPEQVAGRLGIEPGNGFEQGGLAATRGADDSHEMPLRHLERDMIDQVDRGAVFADGETDVLKF